MGIDSFLGLSYLGFHSVSYQKWGMRPHRKRDDVPVICVHGTTRNNMDFNNLAESMQSKRRVFSPDIVGRGGSDWLSDPALYGFPQYISDMTMMIARTGARQVDWVGTSMGGLIGMMLASMPNSPIRRLVLNDIGPFIPLAALQRIHSYVRATHEFLDIHEAGKYMREIYASFGHIDDEDWKTLIAYGIRYLPNGKVILNYDPAIVNSFDAVSSDVDIWATYDKITTPTMVLRGEMSDILTPETAEQMTLRGPKAKWVTIKGCGHAPSLMTPDQIQIVMDFLDPKRGEMPKHR